MRLCATLATTSAMTLAFALAAQANTFYLTVAGLGGEPDYEQRFALLASETEKTLKTHAPDASIETFKGASATKANIRAALGRIAAAAKPQDSVVVLLIGHGTFEGDYKFNLPGPDLSAQELAELLNKIPATRQLVVNTTSASGGGNEALRKANRILISATKTGSENNATVFARFWVEALGDPSADTDKNGSVSAMEAFRFAEGKTKAFYEEQKRLSTEHAVIEDSPKGGAAGQLAMSFSVLRLNGESASSDPAKRTLQAKRDQVESQIDQLKFQKSLLAPELYRAQLSKLLLELARVQEELDK
jgi:hypothetical protein